MKTQNNLKQAGWIVFLIWTIFLAILFGLASRHVIKETRERALGQARAHLSKDVVFRQWAATHGGFYVPVTQTTPANPYLAHIPGRDISTPDGSSLTLMNPAYAARQLNEAFPKFSGSSNVFGVSDVSGIFGHLTSLKLLRPENAPDEWEEAALHKFEKSEKEVSEFTTINGEPYLRLILSLKIEANCLKCHDHQGYAVGDIRGGVAVALSMKTLYAQEQQTRRFILLFCSCLWILGALLILWGSKKLENAYKVRDETLQRLETLYQKSTDGILLIQDGKYIDCNEAALQMLGYTEKASILGRHPADTAPAVQPDGCSSHKKVEEMMQLCLEQSTMRFEWVRQNAQGENSWIEVVLTRIELQQVPVIHVAWRDINELKKDQLELISHRSNLEKILAERTEDLQRSHDAFQHLINDIGGNFVVFSYVGTTGELLYVSKGVTTVFGMSRENVIGKSWLTLVDWDKEDLKQATMNVRQLLEDRIKFNEIEMHFTHPKKGERTVRSSAHLLRGDAGSPVLIGGIIEDITEEKQINRQLKDAQQRAEAANKQKSQFLANMSHEIRTPMNAMIGLSELALETKLSDQQYDYLSKIHSSSRSLLTILNDILDFSKIEAGKITLDEMPFSLAELIDGLGILFFDQAQQKGLELQMNIDTAVPSFLKGDSFRLRQVLVNIMGNAVKFTEQGAVAVAVSLLSKTEKMVKLKFSVTDSGIGIADHKLETLFKAFSQVDASYTRKYGGTGLGLAIASQFIELMGGSMEVQSEQEKGSVFAFTLDLTIAEPGITTLYDSNSKEQEQKELSIQQIAGSHTLLVDDDASNCQFATLAKRIIKPTVGKKDGSAMSPAEIPELTILDGIQLPIINMEEGIARLEGNKELYLQLLQQFGAERRDVALVIKENLQKNESASARQLLHTVKGIAANLGADDLARKALHLEEAVDQEQDIATALDLFTKSFNELLVSISALAAEESASEKQSVSDSRIDSQDLTPYIEELTFMLDASHFNATIKWQNLKALLPGQNPQVLEKIDLYISRFEFTEAKKLLTEITAKIRTADSQKGKKG